MCTGFSVTWCNGCIWALHGTVEDETQMVVVCYERIDGAGGMAVLVQAPGDFS